LLLAGRYWQFLKEGRKTPLPRTAMQCYAAPYVLQADFWGSSRLAGRRTPAQSSAHLRITSMLTCSGRIQALRVLAGIAISTLMEGRFLAN
jgi:hypothetical protein